MWKPRPAKWLLWAPPMVVLTSLAAHLLNGGALNKDLSTRAVAQLAAIGADWAKPTFEGRDASLGGDAPSEEAIDAAAKALEGTYGVRVVITRARVVVPPPPVALVAPTINSLISNTSIPEIKGTWQEGVAKTLSVILAGKVFKFGTDAELTSNAGAWTLKPTTPLSDGTYDVTAEVSDGVNPPVGTTGPAKIVIDTVAPAAPVFIPMASGRLWPFTLNGTWAEGDAISLVAKLAGQIWTLGKDEALKSDGKGNWSFAPVVDLKPGTYDVTLETTDSAGNISTATAAAAIVIAEATTSTAAAIPTPIVPTPMTPKIVTLASPTVSLYASASPPAAITGTWPEGDAASLKVSVPKAGLAAVLNDGSGALDSDGKGNWSLKVSKILEPGSYDVVVETADATGRKSFDQTKFEVFIKEPMVPAATIAMTEQTPPTIAVFSGEQSPTSITGTWDEAHAKGLKISIPGANLSASLGADAALSSVQGAWTLAVSKSLSPGVYNVIAESTDAAGKTVADQTTAEIYVKTPPAPPTPAPPSSYDCAGVLAKISAIFPLRFEFNQTRLKSPLDLAVNQYAALLKDPRCAAVKAEIAGHADFFGPSLYNQALSEWRAQTVVSTLVAAGVDASRLSTKGFSESVPVDSEKSIAARKKNRRVEITLVK